MDRAQILTRVVEVIARECYVEPASRVTPAARLDEDLGLDSLDKVELSMVLEDEFDLLQLDEKAIEWKTVSDVVDNVATSLADYTRSRKA